MERHALLRQLELPQPPQVPIYYDTRNEKRTHIRKTIDEHGFKWIVFWVAASGFFTDSYNLFATNVILPSLAYVFWPTATHPGRETLINCMTLAGSIVGQLLFGYLADRFGRTRLYGIELVIVVLTTVLIVALPLHWSSHSAVAWIAVWRFFMGVGIGAEYPLSAVITAEWAPTQARARMLCAVFFMQPLGQFAAQLVGILVLKGQITGTLRTIGVCTDLRPSIHTVWRIIAGVGAIPALLAIGSRFLIQDTGLYDLDVKDKGDLAVHNTMRLYKKHRRSGPIGLREIKAGQIEGARASDQPLPDQFSYEDIRGYFWTEGNWRYLLSTSACWFILDFAFYGLGIGNPKTLAKVWAHPQPALNQTIASNLTCSLDLPPLGNQTSWNQDPTHPFYTIYDVLLQNGKQNIYTVCLGSMFGSLLLIMIINYIPRKQFLAWSFLWLAALFVMTGISFFHVFQGPNHGILIVLVALCCFSFNCGTNTLTFVIPAEIAPTRYRCTFHGVSAAAGKFASVIVYIILSYSQLEKPGSNGLGWVFIIFGLIMALGAPFAFVWLPELQNTRNDEPGLSKLEQAIKGIPNGETRLEDLEEIVQDVREEDRGLTLKSKTLEELGTGLMGAKERGEVIGLEENVARVLGRESRSGNDLRSRFRGRGQA